MSGIIFQNVLRQCQLKSRCLKKMLMLIQFIQDVMPFFTCYEFLFHKCNIKLQADKVVALKLPYIKSHFPTISSLQAMKHLPLKKS
jgi:hypothetical protein